MRTAVALCMMMAGLVACRGGTANQTGVCTQAGDGQLRCAIEQLSDCQSIRDFPYARNLFCPAAFSAAQTMAAALADSIGAKTPTRRFFYYYQTLADPNAAPDDQAQTTDACLETRAPWGSSRVIGAGLPLCHLIAYVTSPGPTEVVTSRSGNPIPDELRVFPEYFVRLSPAHVSSPLSEFRAGSTFDPRIRNLGAAAHDKFVAEYPSFAPDAIYDPADWRLDPEYHGISGGGGGGWGGEIDIEHSKADRVVLLAFGGGGGGGMTSTRKRGVTASRVGAGGGGGVQFADGYRFGDRRYDRLGLGAGVGSDEDGVQYSYFDYEGSERPAQPIHDYHPAVIADYEQQLSNLSAQLEAGLHAGDTVVLRGGGGMGGGVEYLTENGEELAPHALSTQAGFQFRYEFQRQSVETLPGGELDADEEGAYAQLGAFYRTATARAYTECGRDYSNFPCMCPVTHAIVIRLLEKELGDPAKMPVWLQQQHCPTDSEPAGIDLSR